uniref:Ciliary microtubule associated protein 1B n=1 Tax=Panthera tigris altaica TaxID=74533 RepID=A0A8C9KHX3_PANTA
MKLFRGTWVAQSVKHLTLAPFLTPGPGQDPWDPGLPRAEPPPGRPTREPPT